MGIYEKSRKFPFFVALKVRVFIYSISQKRFWAYGLDKKEMFSMRMKKIVENRTLVSLLSEKNASMKKLVRLGAL